MKAGTLWSRPTALRWLVVLVAAGVGASVAVTLWTTDRRTLEALRHVAPVWLLLAALLALVPWLMEALRLLIWARFFGRRLTLRDTFRCVLAGQVASALAPIAVGNAAAKTAMLVERGLTPSEAATAEGLGAFEDFLFFVVALPLAAWLTGAWRLPVVDAARRHLAARLTSPVAVGVFIGVLVLAATMVFLLARRRGILGGIRVALADVLARGKWRLALTVSLAAVHWGCRYSVVSALAASLGVAANPLQLFFLQWFVFTAMTFVPTPGAVLGAESAFFLVYAGVLPPWAVGVMTAGWRFFSFYFPVILAALLLATLGAGVSGLRGASPAPNRPASG